MTEGVNGDVVATVDVMGVEMTSRGDGAKVSIEVQAADRFSCNVHVDTDFETARRMVEGEVSLLVVVRDGEAE